MGSIAVVAEIGTAHGGSLHKARELIRAAADAGADYVKFQWVYAREILHPKTGGVPLPGGTVPLYERFRRLEVPPDFFAALRDYARERGCGFICSPFGLQSLAELLAIEPDAVKIASPELNHYPLLEALSRHNAGLAAAGKPPVPVILSSGVSTLADIGKALSWFSGTVTLLHCVTAYPAPETEYNVRLVHTLGSIFGVPTGISDHSLDPVLVPVLAAVCGARMVEKHITLSRTAGGLDDPVALEPRDFARMVRRLGAKIYKFDRPPEELEAEFGGERVRSTLGDGVKRLAPAEAANYGRTNRSLHYMRDLRAGQTTATADVGVLRTEKALSPGISPEYLTLVTGARLVRDVADGEGVRLEDFISGETAYSPACGGV